MRTRLGLALVVLLATPACTIYFGGDDGDDDCFADDTIAGFGLRNPDTGACESFGGGGGSCGDPVPLAGDAEGAPLPAPDWGACPSECEALSEESCWAAERCRAVYLHGACPDGLCDPLPSQFLGCWSIAPSGPAAERVACESLDAYECSRHNDCVGNYVDAWARDLAAEPAPQYRFASCGPEPGAVDVCLNLDCGIGYHCEEVCRECDPFESDQACTTCEGVCVPDSTGGTCAAVDCGPGYHCEEQCVVPPCLPDAECPDPICEPVCLPNADPGDCTGDVLCDALPPSCPADTVPGIRNGCWTWYCIPVSECGMSTPPGVPPQP